MGALCPRTGVTLASLHPSILPSLHSTGGYSLCYVLRPGLGPGNATVSQPGCSPNQWIWHQLPLACTSGASVALKHFSPKLWQEEHNASYRESQDSSARIGKVRTLTGARAAPLLKGFSENPCLNHPPLSRHVLVIMSSGNTFWLAGLELRSLLNQAKLRSFSCN